MEKQTIFADIDLLVPEMEKQAFAIFDNPEIDGEEFFASDLLINAIKSAGFTVETGLAGLPTAFRAVWKYGEGGPNIGILGEFDALRGVGHACGHHMQTPAAIAALKALKAQIEKEKRPCTLTLYGTPAEETYGGKVKMAQAGCFKELDAALGCHASAKAFTNGTTLALKTYTVTFKGISSHASGSPHLGKSAMDAMLLTFNAIEFLREHILETSRVHYAIRETVMPSNVVPARAVCDITMRSPDTKYLNGEIAPRIDDIIKGACLMTGTTAEKYVRSQFKGCFANKTLNTVAIENMKLLPLTVAPLTDPCGNTGKGTTDFGDVCHTVPTAYLHIPYCNAPGHTKDWLDAGKTEKATEYMKNSAKLLAGVCVDLLENPEILKKAREEFLNSVK